MDVRVRSCCCALHTFVRVVCIFLTLGYLFLALLATAWHLMATNGGRFNEVSPGHTVTFVLALTFCLLGVSVNLLALLAVRKGQRTLIIPWLVFQLLVIIGLFALGVYVALHFTVLAPKDQEQSKKAYAVLCLFPVVAAIFLIFAWILVDQLFIQMKALKRLGLRTVSTSNLSQLRANGSGGSNPSLKSNPNSAPKMYQKTIDPAVFGFGGGRVVHHTQSLPRPRTAHKRHRVREFSYQVDVDTIMPHAQRHVRPRKQSVSKVKRTRSLEQMLDVPLPTSAPSSESSMASGTSSVGTQVSNVWPEAERNSSISSVDASIHRKSREDNDYDEALPPPPPPSYCTINRAGLRRGSSGNLVIHHHPLTTLPRRNPRQKKTIEPKDFNIGDLLELDALRRASSEHALMDRTVKKNVTIDPDVTEFHYPGYPHGDEDAASSNYSSLQLRLPDAGEEDDDLEEEPFPPPPSELVVANLSSEVGRELTAGSSGGGGSGKSWLHKLSSPLVINKPGYTKDEIIGFYCHQAGDVQL